MGAIKNLLLREQDSPAYHDRADGLRHEVEYLRDSLESVAIEVEAYAEVLEERGLSHLAGGLASAAKRARAAAVPFAGSPVQRPGPRLADRAPEPEALANHAELEDTGEFHAKF